jgi:hypothetical protein
MLLESPEAYYSAMKGLCDKSQEAIVTSFGIFCNLTINRDTSDKSKSEDRKFIELVANHPNLSIVVGVGGYSACKDNCDACGVAYVRRTLRIERHRQEWPKLKWYLCESLHSKVAAFKIGDKYYAIIGSRNFTGSPNKEMAMVVSDPVNTKALFEYATSLISLSKPVTIDTAIESAVNNSNPRYLDLIT